MKIIILLSLIALASFSCKKNYNCVCDVATENSLGGKGVSSANKLYHVKKGKKEEAEASCKVFEKELVAKNSPNFASYTASCQLILE